MKVLTITLSTNLIQTTLILERINSHSKLQTSTNKKSHPLTSEWLSIL